MFATLRRMSRRTRYTLLVVGVSALLLLALGGWIVDATSAPFASRRRSRG
jgi:hypothetical protein